jgi:phage gp45-like
MTQTLVIRVTCDDVSDLDWLKTRCIAPVEDAVATAEDEGRLDGNVSVDWDTEDA